MKLLFVLLSVFFLTTPVAHKNTPLEIDSQGNIIGLPEEFSPAKFDFDKKVLQIKNKTLVFPKCFHSYFGQNKNKMFLSASWYHSKKNMPYYLNFKIWGNQTNNSYQILIDLETLELIKINKQTSTENSLISKKIELSQNCLDAYQNGIRITY